MKLGAASATAVGPAAASAAGGGGAGGANGAASVVGRLDHNIFEMLNTVS